MKEHSKQKKSGTGPRIKVHGIQCPRCNEKLWSKYRHDFHYCGCGYCFVDGGRDYLRVGYGVKPRKTGKDGAVSKKEWAWMSEQNVTIGSPKNITMIVDNPDYRSEPTEKKFYESYPYSLEEMMERLGSKFDDKNNKATNNNRNKKKGRE